MDGYVKFKCKWTNGAGIPIKQLKVLNDWRDRMFDLQLIGATPEGIGYGNISMRDSQDEFIISGTATGDISRLNENHYVRVTSVDLHTNRISCVGPIAASSETMTHAAVYESSPTANAVIHIHNRAIWDQLMFKAPTTSRSAEYGTPEMAVEILKLFSEGEAVPPFGVIALGGHVEGILGYGRTMEEAGQSLLEYVKI